MILFEGIPTCAIRSGEFDLGGRRIAVRASPYGGETGPPAFRFDPVDRRLVARRAGGTSVAGPFSPETWTAAFFRASAGPALIEGPAQRGEAIRGAYRAAAEGAMAAGRGTYLLDPPPEGLPDSAVAIRDGAAPAVALFSWSPGESVDTGSIDTGMIETGMIEAGVFDTGALVAARAKGIEAGVVWPVIPGWTAEPAATARILLAAGRGGARFALAVAPSSDSDFRRLAVDARLMSEPDAAEAFFDTMHHRPWETELAAALSRARRETAAAGLAFLPPRPASTSDPSANVGAAARLEERAAAEPDEHRSARLHAAVRWIDSCGRDLGPVVRDGNFRRVFPLGPELGREVEEALIEALG